jgi:hypothetical protein
MASSINNKYKVAAFIDQGFQLPRSSRADISARFSPRLIYLSFHWLPLIGLLLWGVISLMFEEILSAACRVGAGNMVRIRLCGSNHGLGGLETKMSQFMLVTKCYVFAILRIVASYINRSRYIERVFSHAIHPVTLETKSVFVQSSSLLNAG